MDNSENKKNLTECIFECPKEKREKCLMYPEYCEGEKKEYIDLEKLCSDALDKGNVR